jgi:hypothetical protein
MDSISTARDFFINQQGLSPDQADMIVSKGMEAYNQQSKPQQNMMQMASGGIARLGYQMGGSPMGVEAMPMDTGAIHYKFHNKCLLIFLQHKVLQ